MQQCSGKTCLTRTRSQVYENSFKSRSSELVLNLLKRTRKLNESKLTVHKGSTFQRLCISFLCRYGFHIFCGIGFDDFLERFFRFHVSFAKTRFLTIFFFICIATLIQKIEVLEKNKVSYDSPINLQSGKGGKLVDTPGGNGRFKLDQDANENDSIILWIRLA